MTTAAAIDLVESFRAKCEAPAALYGEGKLDLHDAVDGLQAIAGPLIDTIGQDAVQAIVAAKFRPVGEWERVAANDPPPPKAPPAGDAPGILKWFSKGISTARTDGGRMFIVRETARRLALAGRLDAIGEVRGRAVECGLPADDIDKVIEGGIKASRPSRPIWSVPAPPRRGVPRSTLDAVDYMGRYATDDELRRWLEHHRQYLDEILEHWRNDRAA